MTDSNWIYTVPGENAENLSRKMGLPAAFSQILVNRGIQTAESAQTFLYGTLDNLLDPFQMNGMRESVERLRQAVEKKEKILIFGDYDVDGILSVVALTRALESIGLEVSYFIPERLKKGYGIKEEYLDVVLERGATLVLSVDCGMRAVDFTRLAKSKGVDVIITDHHQPGPEIPEALAVLNPVLESSGYPEKRLAGIGVVFKLIQALFITLGKESILPHYLKLVSIGTISDVAELRGENRLIVKYGLKGLENVANPGLSSLLGACGLRKREINVGDVGFRIGPRINAAGRLGMTDLAVNLFFTQSDEEAGSLVKQLEKMNVTRQKIEARIYDQALNSINQGRLNQKYSLLVLGCSEWHRGVIGIVASKLKDYFYRPVLLFAYEDGKAFGSGRSIPAFSLIECLESNRAHFVNFGGHTHAVGCELLRDNMDAFKSGVNLYTQSILSEDVLTRKIKIDVRLDFKEINNSFLDHLSLLAPFGVGNPKPVLMTENAEVAAPPKKLKGKHSKFLVRKDGQFFEALCWGRADWADKVSQGDLINLAYTLQFNEYLGKRQLNLNIVDIKPV
ncbi:single-stranded-DNA-specific exonuclease RecJ [Acidobacteriota bacterium]